LISTTLDVERAREQYLQLQDGSATAEEAAAMPLDGSMAASTP